MSKSASAWHSYKQLLGYARSYWLAFIISVVGFALYAATQPMWAALVEYFTDAIYNRETEARLWVPAAIIGIFFLRGVGTFVGSYFLAYVARQVVYTLRQHLFQHILHLPAAYFDQQTSGHVISKLTFNVEQVTSAVTDALKVILREGIIVIALLGYLFYQNWRLTLVFFVIGPLIGGVVAYTSRRFRRISRRLQNSMGELTQVTTEVINGYLEVRNYTAESLEKARFAKANARNRQQNMKMVVTTAVSTPIVQLLAGSALAALVYIALSQVDFDQVTPGALVAYLVAASLLVKPLRQLTDVNSKLQKGVAAAQSIFEVLALATEPDQGKLSPQRVTGALALEKVSFRYPGSEEWVLREINLQVAAGQTVALVGRSGSGKSTLAKLLPRLYEVTQGKIVLDGVPITEYSLAGLRQQIAYVGQDITLFNGSIRENICYGQTGVTESQVRAAAEHACALEFIDGFEQGLDTQIGEDGVLLSGGQRQRLGIARALLKDAPILILDEATSALDNESERHVQAALESLMQGRTTLIIAHRLTTIEQADCILLLEQGQVLEQGTHAELLALGGYYTQLYQGQDAPEPVGIS